MKAKKLLTYVSLVAAISTQAFSMEFGTMGNLSASMGGAGVALKSPFALYYNPALLAADGRARIGYSAGIGLEQTNLDKLTNINFQKMFDTLADVGTKLAPNGTGTTGGAGGGAGGGTAGTNVNDFADAVKGALTTSGATGNNLEDLWKSYQQNQGTNTDHSQLVSNLKDSVNKSNMPQGSKDLFSGIVDSIDWSNFDVKNGGISNITIKKGSDGALDEAMSNLNTIFEVLKNNNMFVKSQSGIVFQFPTNSERTGSLAIGMFNSAQAGVSLVGNTNKMRLIFGQNNSYYELVVGDDGYTIKEANKNDYDTGSLLASIESGDSHKIVTSIFDLVEIPVGYAYKFRLGDTSEFSIGIAAKAMMGANLYSEKYLGKTMSFSFNDFGVQNVKYAINVGFDAGVLYSYNVSQDSQFSLGFVVKNINSPTFRFDSAPSVTIKPQYRAGIAYNGKIFSLAFDADVAPNEVLNYSNRLGLSQTIGGGAKIDFRYIDLRAGVSYDLRQDLGVILTAGINILGFIDIAAEVGTKWVDYFGFNAPKYANVRIGGSFSW